MASTGEEMSEPLHLGEPADEADWRALVEQGLKGAPWERLVGKTGDGIPIQPLYREPDIHTAEDVSGTPGAAPFIRGARGGAWLIRQTYAHPNPERTNRDILADLKGGVAAIELVADVNGARGVAIKSAADLDMALADVIVEAAPISLDADGLQTAELLEAKLKGVAAPGTAFNLDPIGALMRTGAIDGAALPEVIAFAGRVCESLPAATALRADARPVHEAGGAEAQEIAAALASGITYLRALSGGGFSVAHAARAIQFAMAVGPNTLIEAAKLRALRLCWSRVLEASGAALEQRAARIHAFTGQRMLTRYDAWTNILRITTAAFGAAIGGADVIATANFTDALGLPTPFARRVARNTQHVLLEECRLGHVADPAGGAWFVEHMTRELAAKAWTLMQQIEAHGGIVHALQDGFLQSSVAETRIARERLIATRRETITGVTDYPLLDAKPPAFERRDAARHAANDRALTPMRWAEPFEQLRDRAEAASARPGVFCATLGALAEFGPRAQFARNLFAAGGVAVLGEEDAYESRDDLIDAFRSSGARVAVICGTDAAYAEEAVNAAQRLKAAGADWVTLAGNPGSHEAVSREAGVDQFVFTGQDAVKELHTLHAALGLTP
jgi:methylmalonyl-CoA mutase